MTNKELAEIAVALGKEPNFYEYGGWGQEMTLATLNALAERYPKNKPVNVENVGKWGFDCICLIKGILAGVRPGHHVNSYAELKKNPIGDCTNKEFKAMLYDTCAPEKAPAGYGIATDKHAALTLGNGLWVDANRIGSQNGIAVHSGSYPDGCICGKIPGVEYTAEKVSEREILQSFCNFLIDSYLNM